MKIIFLDFDGTLGVSGFSQELRSALVSLCESAPAQVVLSTAWAWKDSNDPQVCWANATGPIPDLVPYLHDDWRCARFAQSLAQDAATSARRLEICEWLGRHVDVTHWTALDDAPTPEPGGILCQDGLRLEHIVKARELLSGPLMPYLHLMVPIDYGPFPPTPHRRHEHGL